MSQVDVASRTNQPNITEKRIHKSDVVTMWKEAITINHQRKKVMLPTLLGEVAEPLSSDYQGSRFGHDGIRIEGSINFVMALMGCLDDLYKLETDTVRLEVVMHELHSSSVNPPYNKQESHWVCYIRPIYRQSNYTHYTSAELAKE